ncbi:39S ribosomal protein L19, mitochondrial-like [Limulus polyphemus]|uniref:Large ribosomal subunit protein bL19m n=1 Tax=Limulus polyphemus TaxID=6850 RepID=A0ABM1BTI9_LIMPO|nr:39S ribosomal protein L19, mitochondrial-like [Limulus polyphemus]
MLIIHQGFIRNMTVQLILSRNSVRLMLGCRFGKLYKVSRRVFSKSSLYGASLEPVPSNPVITPPDVFKAEKPVSTIEHSSKFKSLAEYRFLFPEFLPMAQMNKRHRVREILERMDMLTRRSIIVIPEFYVGSIMAVTVSDPCAPRKQNRFVGICIIREGHGLRSFFTLRNVVNNQGTEIRYDLYNPTIQKIEVLRLEKRLDDHLIYLRDALPEYSTFPFDMEPEVHLESNPVPVNPIKVKLKPRPWYARWERFNLKGVENLGLPERFYKRAQELAMEWQKYDMMKEYRSTISLEEQDEIWKNVHQHKLKMEQALQQDRRKRTTLAKV